MNVFLFDKKLNILYIFDSMIEIIIIKLNIQLEII